MDTQSPIDARQIFRAVSIFANPVVARSVFELIITVVPFMLLWALTWAALISGYWLGCFSRYPLADCFLRLFVIQHDAVTGRCSAGEQRTIGLVEL